MTATAEMRRTVVDGHGKENVPDTIGVPVQSKISDFFNKRDGDDRERVGVNVEEESDFSSQDLIRGQGEPPATKTYVVTFVITKPGLPPC